MSGSGDYISREAFLAEKRHLYCENCARRKGMKNGKMKFIYEIGDAPCRACDIGDVLDDVEDFPAADVRPVVTCADCEHNNHCLTQEFVDDCGKIPLYRNTFFCADGERRSNA